MPHNKGFNTFAYAAAAITLIGAALRLWWALGVKTEPVSDFLAYYNQAIYVFQHHSAWTSTMGLQGMGYPASLGLFFILIGTSGLTAAKMYNVLLSVTTLIVLLPVLKRLLASRNSVLAAYALLAVLPNYIAYTSVLGTEVFFTFLFAWIIFVQTSGLRMPVKSVALGILIGLAALTKPIFLAYPVIVALVFWLNTKKLGPTFLLFAVTSLVMCAVVAPWTIRNYEKYDTFVPVSFNSGFVLYLNNNSANDYGGWMSIYDIPATDEFKQAVKAKGYKYGVAAAKVEKLYKNEAVKWIKNNPGAFLKLGMLRLSNVFFHGAQDIFDWSARGWNSNYMSDGTMLSKLAAAGKAAFRYTAHAIMYALSLTAFVHAIYHAWSIVRNMFNRLGRLEMSVLIPVFNLAFFAAVYFVYEGQSRYNFPVLFLFVIVLCSVVHSLAKSAGRSRSRNATSA